MLNSGEALKEQVKKHKAGDTVELTLYRGGETVTVSARLDENDQAREKAMEQLSEDFSKSQQESSSNQSSGDYYNDYNDRGYNFGWPFGGWW